jgi:hypothetical protein
MKTEYSSVSQLFGGPTPTMLERIKASLPSLAPAEQRVAKLVLPTRAPLPTCR